ncbi:hypothetical protein chiPu_0023052, partial [Chiloscyllium punctatum]|nr:hypothetical protein [Chiloscyllium punctatum]
VRTVETSHTNGKPNFRTKGDLVRHLDGGGGADMSSQNGNATPNQPAILRRDSHLRTREKRVKADGENGGDVSSNADRERTGTYFTILAINSLQRLWQTRGSGEDRRRTDPIPSLRELAQG